MHKQGITSIVQADPGDQDQCRPLYQNGGRFYSMEGHDLTASEAATDKSWLAGKKGTSTANLLRDLHRIRNRTKPRSSSRPRGFSDSAPAPNRQELVAKLGGSQESEMAVQDGLEWLAAPGRRRALVGSGEVRAGTTLPACQVRERRWRKPGWRSWHFKREEITTSTIRSIPSTWRGLDWLVKQQKQDGCLFGPESTWYEHGIGTFALAEACAVALANNREPERAVPERGRAPVKFTETHQYQQGGWQYALDSGSLGDTSVSGWQVLSLKSAQEAKIDVSEGTMQRIRRFYETCGDPNTGQTFYQPGDTFPI